MRDSSVGIVTSHAGSLPRTERLIELNHRRMVGEEVDERAFRDELAEAVTGLVARQREFGIDLPNDGEYGHSMGDRVDYGAWWGYVFERLDGLELAETGLFDMPKRRSAPGSVRISSFTDRRDWNRFAEAYADPETGIGVGGASRRFPVVRGPIRYTGQRALQRDIDNARAAFASAGVTDGFLNSVAPGSCARFPNEYYATDEEFVWACAEAMREEYQAIVDAGLILQLDDPCIAENWDQIVPEPSVRDYQEFTMVRVEALNHAIRGLPEDRIRFHLCWGSWHGPHSTDIPMRDIVDVMLRVNAGCYQFEAANVRHEHEWNVWRDVALPEGKTIMPGVVSHSTNLVEHPDLVAQRIVRFAEGVGRERVLAGTDCGLGGRVHPQIAWAKLDSLVQGARLATEQLWP